MIYFWKDGKLTEVPSRPLGSLAFEVVKELDMLGSCCYQHPWNITLARAFQCGYWTDQGFYPMPIDRMPDEFRTHLLLLGIT